MDNPLIIPVFIPHSGCPHQCSFCNQSIITSQNNPLPNPGEIEATIQQYLAYKGKRSRVELAFFGGNFLGLSSHDIVLLLEQVQPYIENQTIHGIRCSTRPDTITEQRLDLVQAYGVSLIELGIQSMDDIVLKKANRGHTSADSIQAVALLKDRQIQVGAQVMAGLPGDTRSKLLQSTRQVAALAPDVARIYPLMVLKGSPLAQWFQKGSYTPLSLNQSIQLVKEMYQIFEQANVAVIRMGLQASEMMEDQTRVLAGPWHPAFGHLVLSAIFYDQVCEKIEASGMAARKNRPSKNRISKNRTRKNRIILKVHPRFESRLRGDKNENLEKLGLQYPGILFSIKTNDTLMPGEVHVQ
jgi:histone acetyltransferase (RNA polymerase elongator complex component)